MDVHDNGRYVYRGKDGGGIFRVGNGDDESIVVSGKRLTHAVGREFGSGADERDVPVGMGVGSVGLAGVMEKAENPGELFLPGDACHFQGDEYALHVF